ncbi:MAG: hypothetical protein NTU61_02320 [Candidatus Altiarchaeota archaeon]|nr:hypothetical protein [Candidatus Altiarchaeota archaeon]
MKKGYILTWDSLIALTVVLLVMAGFIRLQQSQSRYGFSFEGIHFSAEDAMETLSKKGILEEIGYQWSTGNMSVAGNLSKEYLEEILPGHVGYRLEIVNGSSTIVIYESKTSRINEIQARDKTRAVRFISGYQENSPRHGWTARAWFMREDKFNDRFVCENSVCTPTKTEVNLTYDISSPLNKNFFYFKIRDALNLVNVTFNISWIGGTYMTTTSSTSTTIPGVPMTSTSVTTSSSTSTTASTSTTTSTLLCHNCNACGTGSGFFTSADDYNYHFFDVPVAMCNVTVVLNFGGSASYDLYVNWTPNYCPQSDVLPLSPETQDWIWGPLDSCMFQTQCTPFCNSYYRNEGYDGPATCFKAQLPAGRYHAMVDCFSYYPGLCGPGKTYSISVSLQGTGCVTTTTTSTTSTSTTSTTTSTSTTLKPYISSCVANQYNVLQGEAAIITAVVNAGSNPPDRYWITANGTTRNITSAVVGSNALLFTSTGLVGNYSIRCYVNDTAGRSNATSDGWVNIYTTTTTTSTSTTIVTTTTMPTTCSAVKTTSQGTKLQVQNYPIGSIYTIGGNPKGLTSDDIASGCTTPNCYYPSYPGNPVNQCPEDAGTPQNVASFTIRVFIPSSVSSISFKFVAAPEDGCQSPIYLKKGATTIASCNIRASGDCVGSTTTTWRTCTATASRATLNSAGITYNADNDLTIIHEMLGSDVLVAPGNYECYTQQGQDRRDFMHFDAINVTCTY